MTFIAHGAFSALGRIPPFGKILMKLPVRFAASLLAFLLASCLAWADWKPVGDKIKTRWAQKVTPDNAWREYPRPQMVREDWQNLNGLWDYTVRQRSAPENNTAPETWVGKILVPYCIESSLSGVGRILQPNEELWYQRTFDVSKKNSRKLLHFEAVDYQCEVWINGQRVGTHKGGNTPFSFDVTKAVTEGENTVRLKGIVDWAMNPQNKTPNTPPMPSFYFAGQKNLMIIARQILGNLLTQLPFPLKYLIQRAGGNAVSLGHRLFY